MNTIDLGETFSTPEPLSINDEFRDLALDPSISYFQLYEAGLRLSHHNFLLNDYSFFQFGGTGANSVRYAYFPNPCVSGNERALVNMKRWRESLEAGALTQEDFLDLLRGTSPEMRIPLLRYENAPDQYRGLQHPCSHLHIGHHSDNRWAFDRALTPVAFTLLIVKHYYGSTWRVFNNENHEYTNDLEGDLVQERTNCRPLGEDYFNASERRSFHFA